MNNLIRKELFKSLESKYLSEIQGGKSTLMIYFNNPVAIGEHPQHLEEIDKLLDKIKEAEEKIALIDRWVK